LPFKGLLNPGWDVAFDVQTGSMCTEELEKTAGFACLAKVINGGPFKGGIEINSRDLIAA